MGSTINPEPLRKAKNNFHRQRLVWRVNPECNFLLVLDAEKRRFFGAPKKQKRLKIFLGGRKSYLAAEHHNEAAPKKNKKNPEVFPLGRQKILLLRRPPKKPIFGFGRRKNKKAAEKTIWGPQKNCGG